MTRWTQDDINRLTKQKPITPSQPAKRSNNKLRATKVLIDGIVFDSKKEAKRYGELRTLQRAEIIRDLRVHPKYKLEVNGELVTTYKPDFDYLQDNTIVVEDVKGYKGGSTWAYFRLKIRLFQALYPNVVIKII